MLGNLVGLPNLQSVVMARFIIYKVYMLMHDGLVVVSWQAVQFPSSWQVIRHIGGMLFLHGVEFRVVCRIWRIRGVARLL